MADFFNSKNRKEDTKETKKKVSGEPKKKKKELLKELKETKKELKEKLKREEKKENDDIEMIKLNLEILKIEKDVYLENFKKRKKNLENRYLKLFAMDKGAEI